MKLHSEKEFVVNKYITLKLEGDKTNVYVKEKLFRHCSFVLLNFSVEKSSSFDEIGSFDEIVEKLMITDPGLRKNFKLVSKIPVEDKFWSLCSNFQVWEENNYNSSLFNRNIVFPLLKKLTEEGDIKAKNVFNLEYVKRLVEGNVRVVTDLVANRYLNLCNLEELNEELAKYNLGNLNEALFLLLKESIDYLLEYHYNLEDVYDPLSAITYFFIFRTSENIVMFFETFFPKLSEDQQQALVSYLIINKNDIHQEQFEIIKNYLNDLNWSKIFEIVLESYISYAMGRFGETVKINEQTLSLLEIINIDASGILDAKINNYLDKLIENNYKRVVKEELSFNFFGVLLENNPHILLNFFNKHYLELAREKKYLFMVLFLVNRESEVIPISFLEDTYAQLDPIYLSEMFGKILWYSSYTFLNEENLKLLGELGVKIVLYALTRDFRHQFDEGDSEFWEYYADLLLKIGRGYESLIKKEAHSLFLKENRADFIHSFSHYAHKDAMYGVWVRNLLRLLDKNDILDLLFDPRLRIYDQIDDNSYMKDFNITESDRLKRYRNLKEITDQEVLDILDVAWKPESQFIDELSITNELELTRLLDLLWNFVQQEKIITNIRNGERNWKLFDPEKDAWFTSTFQEIQIDQREKKILEEIEHITGVLFNVVSPSSGILRDHGMRMEVCIEGGVVTELGIYDIKLNEFPNVIQDLYNLRSLDLIGTQLQKLPSNLVNLNQLKRLCLSDNLFTRLPENIGALSSLEHIIINNIPTVEEYSGILHPIRIERLPNSIGDLKCLKALDLLGNHLRSLPNTIGNLVNLNMLNVMSNYIEELPESIGKLNNLKVLYINNNLLISLPESIKSLDSLEQISLSGNPRKIRNIPIRSGQLNIPEWLYSLKSLKEINNKSIKI